MLASTTVSGDLKHLKPDQAFSNFDKGCRILYKRRVHIPTNLKRVAISTVDVGGTYYIAGLVFTSFAGGSIQVGYCSKYYATDSVEVSRLLGRTRLPDPARVLDFIIDGPGGEAIVAIDAVYQTRFYASVGHWTSLVSCKLITNRGRSWSSAQGPTKSDHLTTVETIHMSASPGTMITALYGTQNPEFGLSLNTLGIITEKCDLAGLE